MNTTWYNYSDSLGYLTVVTSRLFTALLTRQLVKAGCEVTPEQWALLRALLNKDGQSQDEMIHLTRYEKSSLSRLLDGLERKGLVRRERGAADRRSKIVFITGKGADVGKVGTILALDSLRALYGDIDPGELNICRNVLERIQTELLRMLREEKS